MSILTEREKTHGSYANVARVSQHLKTYLRNEYGNKLTPIQRESVDLICMKLTRVACGDATHEDHFIDIAGYAQLAIKTVPPGSSTKGTPDEPQDPSIGDDWDYDPKWHRR